MTRLLQLRVLALQNVRTAYEPHQVAIRVMLRLGSRRIWSDADRIDHLTWRYRGQISPELWPAPPGLVWRVAA